MSDAVVGPTNGSHLVAQADGPSATAGTRFADSLTNVGKDLSDFGSEDFSAAALAIDGAVATLDVLAFAANPFKELVMAGVGWLIEHVDFLREFIEMVTGSPAEIQALSQTWSNIAAELGNAAQWFNETVAEVDDWDGDTADNYRNLAAAFSMTINDAAGAAQSTSNAIAGAGIVVATVRAIVIELISDFIARAIMKALAALAAAAISFGMSLAPAITSIVLDAIATGAKIMGKFSQLMQKIGQLINKLTRGKTSFGKLKNVTQAEKEALDAAITKMIQGAELSPSELTAARNAYQNILSNADGVTGAAMEANRRSALWQAGGDVPSPRDAWSQGAAWGDRQWREGLSWGTRANNSAVRDAADFAGSDAATAWRGAADGAKRSDESTESDRRWDDEQER